MPAHLESLGFSVDFYMPVLPVMRGRPTGAGNPIARLRDDATLAAAAEEANTLGNAIWQPRAKDAPPLTGPRFTVEPLEDGVVGTLKPALRVFLVAVAVLLIIVCANVANLLLARGTARRVNVRSRSGSRSAAVADASCVRY